MQTVFITGASSGIGRETAKLFQRKGWQVIATMRNPEKEKTLIRLENVKVLHCDITNYQSIKAAVQAGVSQFGKIDVLVNNAGFYTVGIFELATEEEIKRQLDTNLLGLILMTKEILPLFRKQNSGVIINLSSIAGRLSVPLQSLYHAAKWGVEGFTESLQYELKQFNIRVKLIEPGVIATDFYNRSMTVINNKDKDYRTYTDKILPVIMKNGETGSSPVHLYQFLTQIGIDFESVIKKAGLERLAWEDMPDLSNQEYFALLTVLDEMLSDEQILKFSDIGEMKLFIPPLFAAMCAENGYQGIQRLAKYKSLVGPVRLSIKESHTALTVVFEFDYESAFIPRLLIVSEQLLLINLLRISTGIYIVPESVKCAYEYGDHLENYIGIKTGNSAVNQITFSKKCLDAPFITSNNVMWDLLEPGFAEQLRQQQMHQSIREVLQKMLLTEEGTSVPFVGHLSIGREKLFRSTGVIEQQSINPSRLSFLIKPCYNLPEIK